MQRSETKEYMLSWLVFFKLCRKIFLILAAVLITIKAFVKMIVRNYNPFCAKVTDKS